MFHVYMKNISLVKKYALLILHVHSNCTFFWIWSTYFQNIEFIDVFITYSMMCFIFYLIKLNALHISSYQIMLFLDIFIAYLLCIFRASVKIGDKIHVFCQKKMFQPKIPSIFVWFYVDIRGTVVDKNSCIFDIKFAFCTQFTLSFYKNLYFMWNLNQIT